jgi:hypothetical protein
MSLLFVCLVIALAGTVGYVYWDKRRLDARIQRRIEKERALENKKRDFHSRLTLKVAEKLKRDVAAASKESDPESPSFKLNRTRYDAPHLHFPSAILDESTGYTPERELSHWFGSRHFPPNLHIGGISLRDMILSRLYYEGILNTDWFLDEPSEPISRVKKPSPTRSVKSELCGKQQKLLYTVGGTRLSLGNVQQVFHESSARTEFGLRS